MWPTDHVMWFALIHVFVNEPAILCGGLLRLWKTSTKIVQRLVVFKVLITKTVAIDTPGGKRNLKMKIKAQQMTFRQDITKYTIYWLTFRCIVHNIFRAIKLIYKRVLYIYTNSFKRLQYSNKRIRGRMKNNLSLVN
jgi:hypothetical protein